MERFKKNFEIFEYSNFKKKLKDNSLGLTNHFDESIVFKITKFTFISI